METIQMLGSLGEFVGAIAIVATLVYLAIQVRHSKEAMEANTQSLDENRKLAMAQAYQARADAATRAHRQMAGSEDLAGIRLKLDAAFDLTPDLPRPMALDSLSPLERVRWQAWIRGWFTDTDNMFYQFEQGFLDQEYFDAIVKAQIRQFAPMWDALDVRGNARPSFNAEIERVLAEAEEQS